MTEIKEILDLDYENATFTDMAKLGILARMFLEKLEHENDVNNYYQGTLISRMESYARFCRATEGIWDNKTNIIVAKNAVVRILKGITEIIHLSDIIYYLNSTDRIRVEAFLPNITVAELKKTLQTFMDEYNKMVNTTPAKKLKMLKKYVQGPKDFFIIQNSNSMNVTLEYVEQIAPNKVKRYKFYLENWLVSSSESTATMEDLKESDWKPEKAILNRFWPEEIL